MLSANDHTDIDTNNLLINAVNRSHHNLDFSQYIQKIKANSSTGQDETDIIEQ